jgi:hypothetical protein
VARGLESSLGEALAAHGLDTPVFRYAGMALAGLIAVGALLVVVGLPVRLLFRPFGWILRIMRGLRRGVSSSISST